jgi:propanol-preferring alcohol dehydrogenase
MVLRTYGEPLEAVDAEVRSPEPGETLIRVDAAALCASDLHAQRGGFAQAQGRFPALVPPVVLGHQIAGAVVARPSRAGDIEIGDRCVVYCYHFCGACRRCVSGRQNVCERIARRIGFEAPGGFAEYVTVPDRNVVRIPDGLGAAEASVLPDAVATSHHAVGRARIAPGDAVAVIGAGALGLYAVRLAALRGARVVAVDRVDDRRLELARAFGAEATGLGLGAVSEHEPDVVLDFVGTTETLAAAARAVREGGRIVLVGVTGGAAPPLATCAARGVDLRTSLASTPADLLDVLALAEQGCIEPVVADRIALADVNAGMERLARGDVVGRLVVTPA